MEDKKKEFTKRRKRGKSFQSQNGKRMDTDSTVARRDLGDDRNHRNDPAWYNKFPEMVAVAANLSWNVSLGAPITFKSNGNANAHFADAIPKKETGLLSMGFIPTMGISETLTSPLNKCVLEMYNQYRFNKSGSPGYDPADIGKVCLVTDSLYTYIAYLVRSYGFLNLASSTNMYVPRALVQATGMDFDDLLSNKADFLFYINTLIIQAAKINIPKDMTFTDRHVFLATNIFKDEPIERCSHFLYNPEYLWKFDFENNEVVPVNVWHAHKTAGTLLKFSDLVSIGWEIMNSITQVEDFYTLNANALAAYGYDNLHRISPIDPLYVTLPVYREEMLIQLHNSAFCGESFQDLKYMEVMTEGDPNLGALIFVPTVIMNSPAIGYDQLLDIPFDRTSTDDIMEATRFKVSGVPLFNTTSPRVTMGLSTCGTELLTDCVLSYYAVSGQKYQLVSETAFADGNITANDYVKLFGTINMSPQILGFTLSGSGDSARFTPTVFYGDLTNYAIVNTNNLRNMHEAALFSQLAISRSNLQRI